eukprot:TRINITY_DN19543_c0_g1_i1.p1 TRINITY_DN19543_c0_g1~~TRINITY_DN19543_c0_g1_i1.p1  ORF type:complete len:345 (+),score=79.06 TRINITY_DN19543_c0_g1_i1:69-1103(+)
MRRVCRLLQDIVPLREEVLHGIQFRGDKLVGKMVDEDLMQVGPPPPMFKEWNVSHEWGTRCLAIGFEKNGFRVNMETVMKSRRELPVRTRKSGKSAKSRQMGLAASPTEVAPLGTNDATHLTITVKNELNWSLCIKAWLHNGILILRDLITYKNIQPSLLAEHAHRFRRYKGPNLTEFDLVWSLFGGKGYAWNPNAEPIEGRYEVRDDTADDGVVTPEEKQTPEEEDALDEKRILMDATERALRRSLYKNLSQTDVAVKRQQLTVYAPPLPPLLSQYETYSTLPVHDPFVALSPEATDALYDFLDELGINDPNLTIVNDMVGYVEGLEAVRAMHAVLEMFEEEV